MRYLQENFLLLKDNFLVIGEDFNFLEKSVDFDKRIKAQKLKETVKQICEAELSAQLVSLISLCSIVFLHGVLPEDFFLDLVIQDKRFANIVNFVIL